MDNFGEYMTKKRSELFFFIKDFTLAVLRFSDRSEIVDTATGDVVRTLKVKYVSEAVYCGKYDKLYLKSIDNGYVYVYNFDTDELKRLFKLAEGSDRGIFLSGDEESLIAYTEGNIYEIKTETDEYRLMYEARPKCYYENGWDNTNLKCYEFVYGSSDMPSTLLRISYDWKKLSADEIKMDGIPVLAYKVSYYPERDMYMMQGFKHYILVGKRPDPLAKFMSLSEKEINNYTFISEESYRGGCQFGLMHENYLAYCPGGKEIKVLDMDSRRLIKRLDIDRTMTTMQYDPKKNTLYVSTGNSCRIYENFFEPA